MAGFELSWIVSASSFALYCVYYFTYYGKKPQLFKKEKSKLSFFLKKYVPSLQRNYWSLFWVPGGRLQTIVAALLPRHRRINYKREIIPTPDGGQFCLGWASKSEELDLSKPLVIIYPGLVSSTVSGYVQLMVEEILKSGFNAVVVTNRGIEVPILTGIAFCATHTKDFEQAVTIIRDRCPTSTIAAIGVSFGGLLLTRYLGLHGEDSKLQGAFVYCCPFNPVVGSRSLEKWDSWILYNIALTSDLKRIYLKGADKFSHIVDHEQTMQSRSIREFDSSFTSKVFGYESVDHYYQESRITSKMISSIRTPTLCLCSDDDSFVPSDGIPFNEIAESDYVSLALTSGGGHVGHLQGLNPMSTPFFIQVLSEFTSAVFQHTDQLPTVCS